MIQAHVHSENTHTQIIGIGVLFLSLHMTMKNHKIITLTLWDRMHSMAFPTGGGGTPKTFVCVQIKEI